MKQDLDEVHSLLVGTWEVITHNDIPQTQKLIYKFSKESEIIQFESGRQILNNYELQEAGTFSIFTEQETKFIEAIGLNWMVITKASKFYVLKRVVQP